MSRFADFVVVVRGGTLCDNHTNNNSTKDLGSLLADVAAEIKRVLEEGRWDPLYDTDTMSCDEGAARHECHVAIHLVDPTIDAGKLDKELGERTSWLQPQGGGGSGGTRDSAKAVPDPFTLQCARTRANFRPSFGGTAAATPPAASELECLGDESAPPRPKRAAFAGLYIPLVRQVPAPGDSLVVEGSGGGVLGGSFPSSRSWLRIQWSG